MSIRKDEVQVEYTIDGKQGINELGLLESKMSNLTAQQKALQKAYDKDSSTLEKRNEKLKKYIEFQEDYLKTLKQQGVKDDHGYVRKAQETIAKYSQELTANNTKLANNRTELAKTEAQILENIAAQEALRKELGLAGLVNTQLESEYRSQLRLMNNLVRGTDEYAAAQKRLHEIEKERAQRIADKRMPAAPKPDQDWTSYGGQNFQNLMSGNFKSILTGGAIFGAAASAASKVIDVAIQETTEAVQRAREKSKALSGMAAITGLDLEKDAADIRYFGNSAEYMANKFQLSVPDVIAAMSKIGSIKPELLKNKEALAALTEEAITLSKADGLLSVEDAAIALVGSLNQFDKGADQSTRFMNVLAASASAGGAEINEVAASFKVAGAVLSASNISFEQGNALVQTLAKRQLLGAEAGTALRNVFSKLMIANDELNPSIVGVNTALENLSKLSPQEIVKMFGQENLVAAQTLIDLRGEVAKLTDEVTGTSEALDQAKKRMDNLDSDMEGLGKTWDGIFEMNPEHVETFRQVIQFLTKALTLVKDLKGSWSGNWMDVFNPLKIIDNAETAIRGGINRRAEEAQKKERADAKKQGDTDYLNGTKEGNLNQFEGKTQADKQRAYTNKFLNDARKVYGDLHKKLIEARKSNPDDVAKIQLEMSRVAGQINAGKNALHDIEKVEAQNKKMVADIKRGQKKQEDEKKKNGHKSHEEQLAEDQVNNHVRAEQEIAKMKIDAIEDDRTRELAQAKWKRDQEKQERLKLVKDKKMSQADYDAWLKASEGRSLTEIRDINKKHDERLEKEKLEVAVRLSRAVKSLQLQDAQFRVQQAEATPGDDRGLLNARQNLSQVSEKQTLEEKEAVYLQDREKYKHNKQVLATLEEAYQKEVKEIQNRGQRERLQLLIDYAKQTEARTRNAKLEALSLEAQSYELKGDTSKALNARLDALKIQQDAELKATKLTEQEKTNLLKRYQLQRDQLVRDAINAEYERKRAANEAGLEHEAQQADRNGNLGKARDARLALLDSQMNAELRVANLTEQEKTNILQRYQAQRDEINDQSIRAQGTRWLEVMQATVSAIGQLTAVHFDNEETQNNDAKARQLERLEKQKEKGIISEKEYSEAKEKIDKEYEEKQRKLKRKRAEAEKKEALFTAGIQMALNIMKAGINPFAIALATISGVAQIAAIAAREIPEYYEGGFPEGKNQIISVNEKGQEWIAPAWQLQDPASRRALDWLEYRRANKIVGNNGPNLMDVATSVSKPAPGGSQAVTVNVPGYDRFTEVLDRLDKKIDTLEAKISYDHMKDTLATPEDIQNQALAPRK